MINTNTHSKHTSWCSWKERKEWERRKIESMRIKRTESGLQYVICVCRVEFSGASSWNVYKKVGQSLSHCTASTQCTPPHRWALPQCTMGTFPTTYFFFYLFNRLQPLFFFLYFTITQWQILQVLNLWKSFGKKRFLRVNCK